MRQPLQPFESSLLKRNGSGRKSHGGPSGDCASSQPPPAACSVQASLTCTPPLARERDVLARRACRAPFVMCTVYTLHDSIMCVSRPCFVQYPIPSMCRYTTGYSVVCRALEYTVPGYSIGTIVCGTVNKSQLGIAETNTRSHMLAVVASCAVATRASTSAAPSITLNNGVTMPMISAGIYRLSNHACLTSI